jgi:hypothetical protein
MKIDDIKTPLVLLVGSWVITRSARWGLLHLIQENPPPNSLGERIKRVYINFSTSNNDEIKFLRELIGSVYDWTPATIATMSYAGFTVQIGNVAPFTCYVKFPLMTIQIYSIYCYYLIYLPTSYLSSNGPQAIANLAERIQPWVAPTGMVCRKEHFNSFLNYLHELLFPPY